MMIFFMGDDIVLVLASSGLTYPSFGVRWTFSVQIGFSGG